MKNTIHYSNITFVALLVFTMIWGFTHQDIGVTGIIIVATCWAVTHIIRDGIFSLIHLMTRDEEKD